MNVGDCIVYLIRRLRHFFRFDEATIVFVIAVILWFVILFYFAQFTPVI